MANKPKVLPSTTIGQRDFAVGRDQYTVGRDQITIGEVHLHYPMEPLSGQQDPRLFFDNSLTSRVVAIVALQLAGVEEIGLQIGELRKATEITQPFSNCIDLAAIEFGGMRQSSVGDSYILTFPQPSSAIRFALKIQHQPNLRDQHQRAIQELRPRVGIDIGEVLFAKSGTANVTGRHVRCAQNLMKNADSNQILVSRVVYEAAKDILGDVPSDAVWENFGTFWISGYGPVDLMEVADPAIRQTSMPSAAKSPDGTGLKALHISCPGYLVEERLGEGSIAVAYKVRNQSSKTAHVAKFLAYGLDGIEAIRSHFCKASRRTSQLTHDSVGNIDEVVMSGNLTYVIREFFDGEPITSALEGADQIRTAQLFAKVCDTLSFCHGKGVVHGNLKPNNILVDRNDYHRILDFGLRPPLPVEGMWSYPSTAPFGSPLYLSPEQCEAVGQSSTATDVYAVGAMLYEVLAGRPLFPLPSLYQVLNAHIFDPPDLQPLSDAKIPRDLQSICLKAIEKDRSDRYASAQDMADDLRRFVDGISVPAKPTLYENLVHSRATKHLHELKTWSDKNLISKDEFAVLCDAYEELTEKGIALELNPRFIDKKMSLLLLGGTFSLTSAAILIQNFIDVLTDYLLLGITFAISFLANVGWVYLWNAKLVRGAHALMPIGIYSLLAFSLVFFHQFGIFNNSLGEPFIGKSTFNIPILGVMVFPFSNSQYIAAVSVVVLFSMYLMYLAISSKTSSYVAINFSVLYFLILDYFNLYDLIFLNPISFSLACFPLILVSTYTGKKLLESKSRERQGPAWLTVGLAVIFWSTLVLASNLPNLFSDQFGRSIIYEMKAGMLVLFGFLYTLLGLVWRERWPGQTMVLYCGLLIAGPSTMLLGLGFAHAHWEHSWYELRVAGNEISPPIIACLLLSIGLVLVAPRLKTRIFAVVGCVGGAAALWWIAEWELDGNLPTLLTSFFVGCILLALYIYWELQHSGRTALPTALISKLIRR